MAIPSVFDSNLFTLESLTAAITKQPYTPSQIQSSGLFTARGIDTTACFIDIGQNSVALVPASERGSTPPTVVGDKYESRPFKTLHLAQRSTVTPDQVQNVRAWGSEDMTQGVQMKINELLRKHRRQLSLTTENHMLGAIKGQILDADGATVLLDLHAEMGTVATTFAMDLNVDTTKVRAKCTEVARLVDDKLDGVPYTGLRAYCGKDFFDALIDHPLVRDTYTGWAQAENLRQDLRSGFRYGGILFEEYRGGQGVTIADNEAWLVPLGVDEMFIRRYAPADYMETVNTIGIEFYSKAERLDFDKGVTIESQTNPLTLCTRPNAVVQLTIS